MSDQLVYYAMFEVKLASGTGITILRLRELESDLNNWLRQQLNPEFRSDVEVDWVESAGPGLADKASPGQ